MRQVSLVLAVLGTSLTLSAPVSAGTPVGEAIERYVNDAQASGNFHGAILVAHGDEVIYEGSAGLANYEWSIPNNDDTRFRIGSITKQFTAALILQEVERGSIGLDDTISKHLPYYRKDIGDRVTIRQLLNHTSGLPDLTPDFSAKFERNAYSRQEFIDLFCSGDLAFEPGSRFAYSNSGYYILGAIVEETAGQSYGDLLRTRIFEPLGMDESAYVEDASIVQNSATGYNRKSETRSAPSHAALIDPTVPFAMAGIYSTVEDLYKWDRGLYTDAVLSERMRSVMFTPEEGARYSNGWFVYSVPIPELNSSLPITMHQGSVNGFSGVLYRNTKTRDLVVILNNLRSNGSEWKMGEDLLKMLAIHGESWWIASVPADVRNGSKAGFSPLAVPDEAGT